MSHTPYGYRIENGKAVVDGKAAEQVEVLFQSYLSGDSLDAAANKAGIEAFHAGVGKILRNVHYLGDEYYPAIIDPVMFAAVQAERLKRAQQLNRIYEPKEKTEVVFPTAFRINEASQQFDDPFQQAEYAYSLIKIEEH
jgi:hypothetical protein